MEWTADDLQHIQAALAVDSARKWVRRQFPASPHGLTAVGRQDFTTLPFSGARNADIIDADFTGARSFKNEHGVDSGIALWSCRCLRVSFDGAGVVQRLDGIFDQCSFNALRTDHCSLVGLFRDCTFTRANLRRAGLVSNFVRCTFDATHLHVDSWGSSFEECRFINCKISPVFKDIAAYVASGQPVTFSLLTSGRIRPGETASYFTRHDLLRGWPLENAG